MAEQMLHRKTHFYLESVLFLCTRDTLSDDYYVNAGGPSRILHIVYMLSIYSHRLATPFFFFNVLPASEKKTAMITYDDIPLFSLGGNSSYKLSLTFVRRHKVQMYPSKCYPMHRLNHSFNEEIEDVDSVWSKNFP